MVSSLLRLGLASGLFPTDFPNPVYASPLSHTHYMPRPSYSSRFNHPNNIWFGLQIIKLLIITILTPDECLKCSECLPSSHRVACSQMQPRSVSHSSLLSSVSVAASCVESFEFFMICWFHDVYVGLTALPTVANLTGRNCCPWIVGRREGDEVIVCSVFCW
jgi:hypothetical protein